MNRKKFLHIAADLFLCAFFILPGCDSHGTGSTSMHSGTGRFPGDDTLRIPYQQMVRIGESALYLYFDTLIRDSRCPEGAKCIWQGAWEIGMRLYGNDTADNLILGTYPESVRDTILKGYTIRAVDLLPRPKTNVWHAKRDYCAVLLIRKVK